MYLFATKFSPEAANFEKAVFAGYQNAELYLTPTRLMSWRSLSKIARCYELNYVLHFPTIGKSSLQTCEDIVSLAHDINCKTITVHEDSLKVAEYVQALDPQIQLAVENHSVTYEQLDAWIQSNDCITLNVDCLWKNTLQNCELSELRSVVRRLFHNYRDRFKNVHLSGNVPGSLSKPPLQFSQEMVFSILDILRAERYEGMVVSEIDVEFQTGENLERDLNVFRQWQSTRGIPLLDTDLFLPTGHASNTVSPQ